MVKNVKPFYGIVGVSFYGIGGVSGARSLEQQQRQRLDEFMRLKLERAAAVREDLRTQVEDAAAADEDAAAADEVNEETMQVEDAAAADAAADLKSSHNKNGMTAKIARMERMLATLLWQQQQQQQADEDEVGREKGIEQIGPIIQEKSHTQWFFIGDEVQDEVQHEDEDEVQDENGVEDVQQIAGKAHKELAQLQMAPDIVDEVHREATESIQVPFTGPAIVDEIMQANTHGRPPEPVTLGASDLYEMALAPWRPPDLGGVGLAGALMSESSELVCGEVADLGYPQDAPGGDERSSLGGASVFGAAVGPNNFVHDVVEAQDAPT
jgi:hypothetical protein